MHIAYYRFNDFLRWNTHMRFVDIRVVLCSIDVGQSSRNVRHVVNHIELRTALIDNYIAVPNVCSRSNTFYGHSPSLAVKFIEYSDLGNKFKKQKKKKKIRKLFRCRKSRRTQNLFFSFHSSVVYIKDTQESRGARNRRVTCDEILRNRA